MTVHSCPRCHSRADGPGYCYCQPHGVAMAPLFPRAVPPACVRCGGEADKGNVSFPHCSAICQNLDALEDEDRRLRKDLLDITSAAKWLGLDT